MWRHRRLTLGKSVRVGGAEAGAIILGGANGRRLQGGLQAGRVATQAGTSEAGRLQVGAHSGMPRSPAVH